MEALTPIYVADQLLPLHQGLVTLLRGLSAEEWLRPTVAGAWRVRDVVAHLVDGSLKTVSSRRDTYRPGKGPAISSYHELVAHINRVNRSWIEASERLSPALLIELLEQFGPLEAQLLADLPPHEPSPVSVAWAGETESANWMHVGREYTERWHHQMQIRDAVRASHPAAVAELLRRDWCYPMLDLSMRALPRAYREYPGRDGTAVLVCVANTATAPPWSAEWTLQYEPDGWRVWRGRPTFASTTVAADADTMWRHFYNALPLEEARTRVTVHGDQSLAEPLFVTRSVMV